MSVGVHGVFDALVKREETGPVRLQVGRHGNPLVAHRKVYQTLPELEQRLPRIPIPPILLFRICEHLTGETVLQFHCYQWQPVEEQGHIQRFLVPL